jgi:polyhydroxybutyrate depolymerase
MNKRTMVLGGVLALLLLPVAFILSPGTFHRKGNHSLSEAANPGAILPRGKRATLTGGVTADSRSIDVGGKARSLVVVVPRVLDPSPWLILVLHGDGGTASSFHSSYSYERASGSRAVLAYPDGGWDLETLDANQDEAFLAKVIETLTAEFKVDPSHVFATGYSSGGFFINVFACHRPGVLRAIASSAAGAPYKQKEKWPNGYPGCPGQKPTPMLSLHGTDDFGVTVDSGRFAAQYWAYVNGCDLVKQETTAYKECVSYAGCPKKAPVAYCEVPGLGHWVWDESAEASFAFFENLVQGEH